MRYEKKVSNLFSHLVTVEDLNFYRTTRQVDMHISPDCKLRCPYCVSAMNKGKRKNILLEKIGVEKYLERFFAIFGKYPKLNITIAGPGEPSESPYFVAICSALLDKGYKLRVFSNLSDLDNYLQVASHIQYLGQMNITSSYHFGAFMELGKYGRERNASFLKNVEILVQNKIRITSMNTPLSPAMLTPTNIKLYFDSVQKIKKFAKIFVTPVELYGTYKGLPYPQSYNPTEREYVAKIHQRLHYHMEGHGISNKLNYEAISEKTAERLKYSHNSPFLKGMPCLVSFRHVAIDLHGRMYYCQSTPRFFLKPLLDYDEKIPIFSETVKSCPGEMCNCKSAGNSQCLNPHKVLLNEYYYAYYMEHGEPEKAQVFTEEEISQKSELP